MRISDWSSDVCSSDLLHLRIAEPVLDRRTDGEKLRLEHRPAQNGAHFDLDLGCARAHDELRPIAGVLLDYLDAGALAQTAGDPREAVMKGGKRLRARRDREVYEVRPEEHTSELQSLMRITYAVF